MPTILMTGAAGRIGTMLRTRLARPGRVLRLLDVAPLTAGRRGGGDPASVTDLDAMTAACQGADAVIHLGGYAGEEDWASILDVNINGGYVMFEAARRAGVSRVIYASSNHAVGFAPRASFPVPDYAFPEPDTYYGVSKVATEALASMYHHRYGLDTICVRILTCSERPTQSARPVHLAVSRRRRAALRGVPVRAAARIPGHLRGVGQHPGRLGLAERGEVARLRAAGRRRGLRRRRPRPRPGRP